MRFLLALIIVLLIEFACVIGFAYSGTYDVGADVPHGAALRWLLSTTRDHSIATRASSIQPPPLDDPALIAAGAKHYAHMCKGCHLAPGEQDSEMRKGLNPEPPNLTLPNDLSPGEAFWVIKHGIKMTAMPAWGLTHDDAKLWSLVAFVRRLSSLSPAEYQQMTAGAGSEEEEEHGGSEAEHNGAPRAVAEPAAEGTEGTSPQDQPPDGSPADGAKAAAPGRGEPSEQKPKHDGDG